MNVKLAALLPLILTLTACGHKAASPVAQTQWSAVPQTIASTKYAGTMEPVSTWHAHSETVAEVAFSPNGSCLATSSRSGDIREWNVSNGKQRHVFAERADLNPALAYSEDGRLFAAAGSSGTYPPILEGIKIWDAQTKRLVRTLPTREGLDTLWFTPDSHFLIVGGAGGLTAWRTANWHLQFHWPDIVLAPPTQSGMRYVLLHGKKAGVYTDGPDGTPCLVHALPFITASPDNRPELALSPDGKMITLVASRKVQLQEDGQKIEKSQPVADLRDTATGRRLKVFGPPADTSRAFSPDGRTLGTWSFDSGDWSDRLRFWNVRTGQVKDAAKPQGNDLICASFSPDGKTLATGSSSGDVSLWQVPKW